MKLSFKMFADLADRIYRKVDKSSTFPLDGISFQVVDVIDDKGTGYYGALLYDVVDKIYIVVNRGTESGQDWAVDAQMALAGINPQWPDAKALAQEAYDDAVKNGAIVYAVGHSLGGSLAEMQCMQFGFDGVTFNAYGTANLNFSSIDFQPTSTTSTIVNYRTMFDLASASSTHFGDPVTVISKLDLEVLKYREAIAVVDTAGGVQAVSAIISDHGISNFTSGVILPASGSLDYQQGAAMSEEYVRLYADGIKVYLELLSDSWISSGDLNPAGDLIKFYRDGHGTDLAGIKAIIPRAADLQSGALDGACDKYTNRQALVCLSAVVLKRLSLSVLAKLSLWQPGSGEPKLDRKMPMKSGSGRRLAMVMGAVCLLVAGCDSTPPPPVKAQLNPNAHEVTIIDLWVHDQVVDGVQAFTAWEPKHSECAPVVGIEGYRNVFSFGTRQKVERVGDGYYRAFILEDQYKKGKCDWENGVVGLNFMSSGNIFSAFDFTIKETPKNKNIEIFCLAPTKWHGECYTTLEIRRNNLRLGNPFRVDMEIKK